MIWIYDIETFINFFVVTFKNPKSQEIKKFIIFEDINQGEELVEFILHNSSSWFIGYNSFNYDDQLLNYIYKNSFDVCTQSSDVTTLKINDMSNRIIYDKLSDYKYNIPFKSLDLMRIGRYKKSLKLLGVSLRWHKLQDMPVHNTSLISKNQIDLICEYNLNDVLITEKLYEHLKDSIKFRHELSKIYEISLYNESDTGIADRLLEKFYSEVTGLKLKDFKDLRTERKFIKFDWVIFDDIHFNSPEFIDLLEKIKEHTYYKDQPFFSRKITFNGTTYKLGIGGLHSEDEPGMFEATDTFKIIDADIGSMYPTTMVNHSCTPEHLGLKFLKNFRQIRNDRLIEKSRGNKTKSEGLKLIMNAAIGKTRNKYSFLYDPLVNLQITINGQLYILMLIERLVEAGFKVISANTDGIITLVDNESKYKEVCETWEQETSYSLEYTYYKKYIRKDVNNYLAVKLDDEVKEKGVFAKTIVTKFNNGTDPLNRGWDKPVVSIALYDYFINNIPVRDTILNHKDIHDFCIAKRIDDKFTNEFHTMKNGEYNKEKLQRSVRYYVSTDGGVLLKTCEEEDKTSNYEVNKRVTIFNDVVIQEDFSKYNIDYSYYINSAQKIIDLIINPQLTLF